MTNTTNKIAVSQPKVRLSDPHDCTDDKDVLTVLNAVYDTLVVRDRVGYKPGLADHWTVSNSAKTWRFTLRDGALFHDGSACDANAVVRSLNRMARPDKGYTLGAPGVWHQYLGGAEIRTDGPRDVVVHLAAPLADLLDILAQGFIAAPASLAALDADETAPPCGSGPYRVVSVAPGRIEAQRMKGHPRAGSIDRIVWQAEPDPAQRLADLQKGAAHVATALPMQDIPSECGLTVKRYENPVAIIYLLNAAKGPLKDPRLRKALNLAVDRSALVCKVKQGAAVPLHAILPHVAFGADRASVFEPDLSTAKALMSEAGFPDGLRLSLDCPTRLPDEAEALTVALAEQLAPLNIALDVKLHHDREAYAHMVRRKEIGDLCVFDSSPISTFRVLYEKIDSRVRGSWWQGYSNRKVEELLDRARKTTTQEREAIYAESISLLQDDPPWLALYTPVQSVGLVGDHPGFEMPPDAVLDVTKLPVR